MELKKVVNYFYDGNTKNPMLEEIKDLKDILNNNIIYLGLYLENNND